PVKLDDKPLPPAQRDPDDPGPPTLKRGGTLKRRPPPAEVASARVSDSVPEAPAPAPETERPSLSREAERSVPEATAVDPAIASATEAAESFTETLPNYVCQQFTSRFVSTSHIPSWRPVDVVSAEVVYENGRENYRNIQINGKPVRKGMEELSGAWSTGEFGTLLRDLFSPATSAQFRYRKESAIAGMSAAVYDFQVEH